MPAIRSELAMKAALLRNSTAIVTAFEYIQKAIEEAGYKDKVSLGIDAAASSFFDENEKSYTLKAGKHES